MRSVSRSMSLGYRTGDRDRYSEIRCGTDLAHFYETLTVPQLQQAFKSIALQMSTLYLAE